MQQRNCIERLCLVLPDGDTLIFKIALLFRFVHHFLTETKISFLATMNLGIQWAEKDHLVCPSNPIKRRTHL